MPTFVRVCALATLAFGLVVACGGEPTPADNCRDFLDLTVECAAQAGQQLPVNTAACDDPSVEQPRTRAQMECALENKAAYCATVIATYRGGATEALVRDPAVLQLNACIAAFTAAEPCKAAIVALGECGAGIALAGPETCTGPSATFAQCIVDHKAAACSLYKPGRTSSTLSAEEQAFQTCGSKAVQASDAGRD